ncbi:MAG: hypothetical protein IPM29_05605 [Planctomycetes bacterium]|nr:hypothetical protein [Planctomycetota bacterium]
MSTNLSSRWAIVLAGGDGSRLRSLTRDRSGTPVPKQFCALRRGGPTLLASALERAERCVPSEHVLVSVVAAHRNAWVRDCAGRVAIDNVVEQPCNRGTAVGLLLPLLLILERDPDAQVVVLPSDHHVEHEAVMGAAIESAFDAIDMEPSCTTLLGMAAGSADPGYGWIVPGCPGDRLREVAQFIEKPGESAAAALHATGALWNTFVLTALGRTLRALIERRLPELVWLLRPAARSARCHRAAGLDEVFEALPHADFSQTILASGVQGLRVLEVPPCGWSDLGTPERLAACLRSSAPGVPRRGGEEAVTVVLEEAIAAGVPLHHARGT